MLCMLEMSKMVGELHCVCNTVYVGDVEDIETCSCS